MEENRGCGSIVVLTDKEAKTHNERRRAVSSINAVGETGWPHAKERSWTLISYYRKINVRYIDLTLKKD